MLEDVQQREDFPGRTDRQTDRLPGCSASSSPYTFPWLLLCSSCRPAFLITDGAGLCDFSWSSNYLNSVCVRACVSALPELGAARGPWICHRVLEAESVSQSSSSSPEYVSAPRVHTHHTLVNTDGNTQSVLRSVQLNTSGRRVRLIRSTFNMVSFTSK